MARIRRAMPSDAEGMAVTVAEGFTAYRVFAPEDWAPPDRLEFALGIAVRLRSPHVRAWVAEDEEAQVGHVTYLPASESRVPIDDPSLAHLEQLFVRPSHFGTGVARRLLALATGDARDAGYTHMRLATPVAHARARRFYQREGWRPVGDVLTNEPIGLDLQEYRVRLR